MGTSISKSILAIATGCQMILATGCATHIEGKVVGLKPASLSEARVNLSPLTGNGLPQLLELDDQGIFQAPVEKGNYLVEVLVPGYKPQSIEINSSKQRPLKFQFKNYQALKPTTIGINKDFEEGRGSGSVRIAPPSL